MERSILATLLDGRHKTAVATARAILVSPDAFYTRDHRVVWLAICDLDDQALRVDAMTISEKLMRWTFEVMIAKLKRASGLPSHDPGDSDAEYPDSALAAIGGHSALGEIAGAFAPVSGLEQTCRTILDLYGKRQLIGHLAECTERAQGEDGLTACLDELAGVTLHLGRGSGDNKLYSMDDALASSMRLIQERASGVEDRIMTGFSGLDSLLSGMRKGGLYILAARPGGAKTSLALDLSAKLCCAGKRVLYFSLEMLKEELATKLLAQRSAIDFRTVETGLWDDVQHQAIAEANADMKPWKLQIYDESHISVIGVRSAVKRLTASQMPDIVVLDYLQLLDGSRHNMTEYEKISEISRTLKIVARELGIPILALSQMSRDSEKGTPREPRLTDLRGSGTIEQDADAVIFIHRVTADENAPVRELKILIAKNRFGPIGSLYADFIPSTMVFIEKHRRSAPEPAEEDQPAVSREARINRLPVPDEDVF